MTNLSLSVFEYQSQAIRVVLRNGEPWFVTKDVCAALEIKNSGDALTRLDEDEQCLLDYKEVIGLTDDPDTTRLSAISEAGLYSLVLGSRKPQAKPFKRWVTHEVIPTIRKTGKYEINPTPVPAIAPEMSPKDVINFSLELLTLAGINEPIRASFGLSAIAKIYPGYSPIIEDAKKLVSAQAVVEELPVSPTELGLAIADALGLPTPPSAIKVNKALEDLGFQTSSYEENSKGKKKKVWKATEQGKEFSQVQVDTTASGKTIFKTSWFPSVVDRLKEAFV